MCGFVGFVNFKNDVSSQKNILLNMNSTLSKRGPDEDGVRNALLEYGVIQ